MIKTKGYATHGPGLPLALYDFERHEPKDNDVAIETLFCGVCHSDLHDTRNEWLRTRYPIVPGHEIIGRITQIGDTVTQFTVGDLVGVGPIADSCGLCENCTQHLEQYCLKGFTELFNSVDTYGEVTKGGYANNLVVSSRFVFKIPASLQETNHASLAPLFCAGITTYSPLKYCNVNRKSRVGIVGIGGLGHLAIKSAKALGAEVIAFTTTPWKAEDAKRLGAADAIFTFDTYNLQKQAGSFDCILWTLPVTSTIDPYIQLLKRDGIVCLVGIPGTPLPAISVEQLIRGRRHVIGSLVGGTAEMKEFLEFCGTHAITADVEIIGLQQINDAFERMLQRNVKYRSVIDMKKTIW